MKKFSFSLQKVLEYRSQLEKERMRAYGTAVEVLNKRRDTLTTLSAELGTYRTRLASMGIGTISARSLALYRSYLAHCETMVSRATVSLEDASRHLEERRRTLVAAAKDRRVLERLKEIKRTDYDYQASREETRDLDEIGTRPAFARNTAAEDLA